MAKQKTSNGATMESEKSNGESRISPPQKIERVNFEIREVKIRLVGDAPLICHAWSVKARKQMLDKQMGTATAGRQKKNPESDFEQSLYPYPDLEHHDGTYGFPAIAFKLAAVEACTSLGREITKVQARQAFHVQGELIQIDGVPTCREDMVRVGMGTADIRHRGEFKEWSCVLHVRYNARVLTLEQVVNLFNIAGFAVGVGEWRPERDGQFGLFHCA